MSNSSLVNHYRWSPNHSGVRNSAIDIITIHMVVGQCAIETLGAVFANPGREASSNYGIGYDGRIGQFVDEANRSWCSSSSWNDNRAITIETASDNYYPYAVNYAAYEALIKLCADICKRHGKTKMVWYPTWDDFDQHYKEDPDAMYMTLHRWFSATSCPGAYLEGRMGDIARRVTEILSPAPEPAPAPAPAPEPSKPTVIFTDVNEKESYAKAVYWAVGEGIVKGYDDKTFRPDNACTRAQFVTMLWRMMGRPEAKKYTQFKDSAFFGSASKAIQWAAGEGIVKGYSSGYFGPDDKLTRAQAAVIIWRWAKKPTPQNAVCIFTDVNLRLASARAIQWGAEQKIIKGYSDNSFKPNGVCLRRHAVTFLYRLSKTT